MTDPCADGGIPQIDLRIAIPHPPLESNSEPLPDVHETKFRAARFPHHRGTAHPSQHVGVCTTQRLGGEDGNERETCGNYLPCSKQFTCPQCEEDRISQVAAVCGFTGRLRCSS